CPTITFALLNRHPYPGGPGPSSGLSGGMVARIRSQISARWTGTAVSVRPRTVTEGVFHVPSFCTQQRRDGRDFHEWPERPGQRYRGRRAPPEARAGGREFAPASTKPTTGNRAAGVE